MRFFRRKKVQKTPMDLPMLVAVRMIHACAPRSKVTPREEFDIATRELIASGSLTPEKVPWLLDEICKMKGNAGELGREVRYQIRRGI
jgi:hypothetical protein